MRVLQLITSKAQTARAASSCWVRSASTLEGAAATSSSATARSPTALGLKPRNTGLPQVRHMERTNECSTAPKREYKRIALFLYYV